MILERNEYRIHRPSARSMWARPLVHLPQTRPYEAVFEKLAVPSDVLLAMKPNAFFLTQVGLLMMLGAEREGAELRAKQPLRAYNMIETDELPSRTANPHAADLRHAMSELPCVFAWRELLIDEAYLVHVAADASAGWDDMPDGAEELTSAWGVIANIDGERRAHFSDGTPVECVRVRTIKWPHVELWAMGPIGRWGTPVKGALLGVDLGSDKPLEDQAEAHFVTHVARSYRDTPVWTAERDHALHEARHLAWQMAPYVHAAYAMRKRQALMVDVTMDQSDGSVPVSDQIGSDTMVTSELAARLKDGSLTVSPGWKGVWLIG